MTPRTGSVPPAPPRPASPTADTARLHAGLARWLRQQRLRSAAGLAGIGVPPVAAVAVVALRAAGLPPTGATAVAAVAAALTTVVAVATAASVRRHRLPGLLRALDTTYADLDDSTALALQATTRDGLQALQQARVRQRLAAHLGAPRLPAALRPPTPRRSLAAAWTAALLLGLTAWTWPVVQGLRPSAGRAAGAVAAGHRAGDGVADARLTITPPAYLGAPARTVAALDAQLPADSRVDWSLALDGDPPAAALAWSDGSRTPLTRDGGRWRASMRVAVSALYRVERSPAVAYAAAGDNPRTVAAIAGTASSPLATEGASALHRLDVQPDTPPEVTVRVPAATLTLHQAGQSRWDLAFEATDDHALGAAVLSVRLAQGSGEQIKVSREERVLDGEGDALHRRYATSIDLGGLGVAQGEDLIVQLDVADLHAPQAQHGLSPNLVLRWPADGSVDSAGLDGPVQQAMPTAFRSERQIIIDTEALIAARAGLAAATLAARADGLGVDQKVLRLRYGQFLGEGFESTAEHAPPGVAQRAAAAGAGRASGAANRTDPAIGAANRIAPAATAHRTDPAIGEADRTAIAGVDAAAQAALRNLPPEGTGAGPPTAAATARGDDVLRTFGHVHDEAEATTLLDPQTQATLRRALAAMWQAELALRQARLDDALPHEHAALEAIKQVQQAERIHLARAGQNLPEVDAGRRLSGDRQGLADRTQPLPAAAADSAPATAAWRALADGASPDIAALAAWARQRAGAMADPLGLLAAAEAVQRDPGCRACREALRARLWPLLPPTPPTGVRPRAVPDATAAAYLSAIGGGHDGAAP